MIVAEVAHVLATPYTVARHEPISRLMRMHEQARQIVNGAREDSFAAVQSAPLVRLR